MFHTILILDYKQFMILIIWEEQNHNINQSNFWTLTLLRFGSVDFLYFAMQCRRYNARVL